MRYGMIFVCELSELDKIQDSRSYFYDPWEKIVFLSDEDSNNHSKVIKTSVLIFHIDEPDNTEFIAKIFLNNSFVIWKCTFFSETMFSSALKDDL